MNLDDILKGDHLPKAKSYWAVHTSLTGPYIIFIFFFSYQKRLKSKTEIAHIHLISWTPLCWWSNTSCISGMLYGFHSLWFDTLICCHHKNNHICNISSSSPHGFKCCMTRRINKCYCLLCARDLDYKTWRQK